MATLPVEVATLKVRVDEEDRRCSEILAEIRKINERLDADDKRFAAADIMVAENRGMRKVIMALGTMVFAGLVALGGWLLWHIEPVIKAVLALRGP